MQENGLVLNENNKNFIEFQNNHHKADNTLNIMVNDYSLEEVQDSKFLGVNIDKYLTWDRYVDDLCNRVNSGYYVLWKTRRLNDNRLLKAIYHGLIISHIQYAILLWGSSSQRNLERVFKTQKAVRCMLGMNPFDSCREAFRTLGLLTVPLCIYE